MNRERVQRIMLEDRDQAARSRDPVQLLQPRHVLLVGVSSNTQAENATSNVSVSQGIRPSSIRTVVAIAGITLPAQREAALRHVG